MKARASRFTMRATGLIAYSDLPPETMVAVQVPGTVSRSVGVADPERTAACLAAAGVAWRSADDGRLLVPPAEATGVVLEFAAD